MAIYYVLNDNTSNYSDYDVMGRARAGWMMGGDTKEACSHTGDL
jgi:hypothetical protein